jgi:predicted methyltransferase
VAPFCVVGADDVAWRRGAAGAVSVRIIQGDVRDVLRTLQSDYFDCVVSSRIKDDAPLFAEVAAAE